MSVRNRGAENEVPFRVQKENAKCSQFELWLLPFSRAAWAHTVIRASALVLKKILFCVSNYHRLVPFITSNKNEYWKNEIQETTKACKVQAH